MVLIMVLLAKCMLCWTAKPIDYTPLLKYLDDDIIRDLIDPVVYRGKILLDYLEEYKSRLIDSRHMIQQDVYEAYIKALELKKIGGPQFLKADLDTKLLQKVYNWTDTDFTHLNKEFESTKQIWKDVEAELEPAEARFKKIHEKETQDKAEQMEREQKRIEQLRKTEEDFVKKVTVNIGTKPQKN